MEKTRSSESILTKRRRIAEHARNHPETVFTSLNHLLNEALLIEACENTRRDAAVGVDGQTAEEYEKELQENLRSLKDRAKSGRYRAPPVRRTYIPKGKRGKRPLGIPCYEDKILQRAVATILGAIYEEDFLDSSYGFRPGRSAHQALQALRNGLMDMRGGYVIDADIQGYFDAIDHKKLNGILDKRVRDGVVRRLIGKWLKAGVLEDGAITRPETGTPQGGVISPLLANIYLHEVLDQWFEEVVKPRLDGAAFMIRFADDFVIVCEREHDARRVLRVLPKRFGKYGLTLHPEKTRLVPFSRPKRPGGGPAKGKGGPTFDLLGFTHYWGSSRKGNWVVKQKTAADRHRRTLTSFWEWCRAHRHDPMRRQRRKLNQKLQGHYGYYGITNNYRSLAMVHRQVERIWKHWLGRRSQRAAKSWERFNAMLKQYPLKQPRIVHSYVRRVAKP